jgi:tripartite-type tricarboxylate transporter receptor subunit TctC
MSSAPSLGRPYLAPPGVPADRLETLRSAFEATMKDKEFLAEAEQLQLDIDLIGAAEITKLVLDTVKAPSAIVAKAKSAIESSAER